MVGAICFQVSLRGDCFVFGMAHSADLDLYNGVGMRAADVMILLGGMKVDERTDWFVVAVDDCMRMASHAWSEQKHYR